MELALADPSAIRLEIGEPDHQTPAHICDAAAADVSAGHTGYTSSNGLVELREALARKLRESNGIDATPDQVVVTHGAMQGLATAMRALLGPGDELLVPDPEFPNWRMAAIVAGATVRTYPTSREAGFIPDPADIAAAIGPKTRAILVCSPNNPTGAVYPAEVLRAIAQVAEDNDLWMLSDECYEAITFGVPHTSPAIWDRGSRVITFCSFSKSYSMTGWRMGYAHVPDPAVADLMTQLAEATIACPSRPSQRAALAALAGSQDCVTDAVDVYRARRDAAVALLERRGVPFVRPDGAFYLMVDVSAVTDDSFGFAVDLLRTKHVAVSPGVAFGAAGEGMVRISLASATESIMTGLELLCDMLEEWPQRATA